MSNVSLSIYFFFQLALILATVRVVGLLAKRIGQPQVVGEMIAGVLLGPSLLGLLAPGMQADIFPKETMGTLFVVAQLGLVLYMFLVGLELEIGLIRNRVRSAVAVSVAGISVPFLLGGVLAATLGQRFGLFASTVSTAESMLFMGAAMSITAFPMLARIIHERGLAGSSLGTLALAAGAIDDASAWAILAVVLASLNVDPSTAVVAIGGGGVFASIMLLFGRRLLAPLGRRIEREGAMSSSTLAAVVAFVMVCAWFTDLIGIYAVFGAFLAGVAMPRGRFAAELRAKLEPTAASVLLPLFFVYSGLNTRIGLLNEWSLWLVAGAVVAAAVLGKGLACAAAARLTGESGADALAIGSLMNARGLMELIILNIGLDAGLITPTLFTIMVVMAIVTTLMASPLFVLSQYHRWWVHDDDSPVPTAHLAHEPAGEPSELSPTAGAPAP